ncbi:AraC family transcriptional regulator [Chania multitudinisentens RB-25]|uniref:Arabinose operon regulatory protein n=1 Tax=Chania multitudinisentens RB-25 TaxID=1441930 RepID=W0L8U7_9GAMM|nr:helix-turn-helix domain-containing protein [Chania multitudinisentens]AHG20166.1 AraC family transcriptional regulator [Chania multitudinisentens RB-25]
MNNLTISMYFKSESDKLSLYKSDPEDNCCEHTHEFDEIVIVEQGHGLHVINGRPFFVQQGDVFLVKRDDYHFYDELGTLKLINILINPNESFEFLRNMELLLERFSASGIGCYAWLPPNLRIECNSVIEQIFNTQHSKEQSESLFFRFIMIVIQAQSQVQKNNTRYKLHKLLNHLQENCFQQHDWDKLAQHFHLTPRTMFRHIKEATGITPEHYLRRLRLMSARSKIRESDMTITEIAFLCGFVNSNHFTSLYKKTFGITPTDERRKK